MAAQTTERVQRLFAFQAERLREYHRRALELLPEVNRYSQSGLLVHLELTMALLAEIAEDGYRLLEQHIQLTPLRKLWLAWRARRRHRRLVPASSADS
jgi:phytoene synthase